MTFSPSTAFQVLLALLMALSAYFTIDVELRMAQIRGSAVDLELSSGADVRLLSAIDGDEVSVKHQGRTFTVRLLGIKAFEALNEPGLGDVGRRATEALNAHRQRTDLTLHFTERKTDSSGRILAYLHGGQDDLGEDLVQRGLVLVYTRYPFEREAKYLATELGAQTETRGLWGHTKAVERAAAMRTGWAQP